MEGVSKSLQWIANIYISESLKSLHVCVLGEERIQVTHDVIIHTSLFSQKYVLKHRIIIKGKKEM